MNDLIRNKLSLLPASPGCYLMKNKEGTVIYVGKAKKLKNRVHSYFVGVHNYKTTKLVSEIEDFDYIVTDSEKYDLEIDGESGDIVKKEKDDDYVANQNTTNNQTNQTTITEDEAKKIATDRIGGSGEFVRCELDNDDGVLKYEIEVIKDNTEYDIDVDATTGEITKYEEDRR